MNFYNIKTALRDTFYGEPRVLYGTRDLDARALASLSCGTKRVRATNGRRYWYLFVKDINNRDVVRMLLRRNGLRPEFHMSSFYAEPQPAFRVQTSELNRFADLQDFTKLIADAYSADDDKLVADMARYVDTIKTKLSESKVKSK